MRYDTTATSLSPTSGPVRGGSPVRVFANGLLALPLPLPPPTDAADHAYADGAAAPWEARQRSEGAMCAFGTDVRPAVRQSTGWIECLSPPAFNQDRYGCRVPRTLHRPIRVPPRRAR